MDMDLLIRIKSMGYCVCAALKAALRLSSIFPALKGLPHCNNHCLNQTNLYEARDIELTDHRAAWLPITTQHFSYVSSSPNSGHSKCHKPSLEPVFNLSILGLCRNMVMHCGGLCGRGPPSCSLCRN